MVVEYTGVIDQYMLSEGSIKINLETKIDMIVLSVGDGWQANLYGIHEALMNNIAHNDALQQVLERAIVGKVRCWFINQKSDNVLGQF